MCLTEEQRDLVMHHISLAVNMARRYAGLGRSCGLDYDDLRQSACVGLCEAALRWDASRKTAFSSYAFLWCRKMIIDAISRCRTDVVSLDDGGQDFCADVSDERDSEYRERVLEARRRMERLCDRERRVVSMLYGLEGEPQDWRQIAASMKLSRARCHEIYEDAMCKMEFFEPP